MLILEVGKVPAPGTGKPHTVEEGRMLVTRICWRWRCAGAGGCLKALLTGRLMHRNGDLGVITRGER